MNKELDNHNMSKEKKGFVYYITIIINIIYLLLFADVFIFNLDKTLSKGEGNIRIFAILFIIALISFNTFLKYAKSNEGGLLYLISLYIWLFSSILISILHSSIMYN